MDKEIKDPVNFWLKWGQGINKRVDEMEQKINDCEKCPLYSNEIKCIDLLKRFKKFLLGAKKEDDES